MSVIIDKMSVAKSVIVEQADSPLDARTRCNNVDDFPNIETPYIGMLIYTVDDGKFRVVTKLKSKLIGSMAVENMAIDEYAEFNAAGGGTEYTAGGGISISDKNVISVDFNTVAKKSDIVNYTAGNGISIQNGVITCTVTGGATEYSAGDGLQLVGTKFEVDYSKVAKKSDIKTYSGSDNITVGSDGKIDVTDKVALKSDIKTYTAGNGISISDDNEISIKGVQYFDKPQEGFIGLYTDADGLHFTTNLIVTKAELSEQLGDINSILDEINGEEI